MLRLELHIASAALYHVECDHMEILLVDFPKEHCGQCHKDVVGKHIGWVDIKMEESGELTCFITDLRGETR